VTVLPRRARRAGLLSATLSFAILTAVACQGDTSILSGEDIVSRIPWRVPEEARYRLLDGEEVKGSGILRIESADGEVTFTQEFESEQFRDEVVAVADAQTLRASSVRRVIDGPEGSRRWEVEYRDSTALVIQHAEDDERRDEVSAPTYSHDSWTDVFVWRTIDFREGYQATYTDVLSATLVEPQTISQTVKVAGRETVEVPAGTFQAWRLEIRSRAGEQKAWFADNEARTLVRYDSGDLVFELLSVV
jgi:hypothetical protein